LLAQECSPSAQVKAAAAHVQILTEPAKKKVVSDFSSGGANTTKKQEGLLFSCFMTRGWLRQEENHYISFMREETLKMDKEV
jgi:hypothetical protein